MATTDFKPVDDIADARRKRKSRQAFYTPMPLVSQMVDLVNPRLSAPVLEPSAGDGRIVHLLISQGYQVHACEMDSDMHVRCQEFGATMLGHDFLEVTPTPVYTAIVMNPPFTKGQAQRHIEHAAKFLAPCGNLVVVSPLSLFEVVLNEKLAIPFPCHVELERLPRDTFTESGASVETLLVYIARLDGNEGPVCGYRNAATANAVLSIQSDPKWSKLEPGEIGDDMIREIKKYILGTGGSIYGIDWQEVLGESAVRGKQRVLEFT